MLTKYTIAFMRFGRPYNPIVKGFSDLDSARKYAISKLKSQDEFTGINIFRYLPNTERDSPIGRISKRFPSDSWNYDRSLTDSDCQYAWFSIKSNNFYEVSPNGKLGKILNRYIDFH